jgi:hypothetical protein
MFLICGKCEKERKAKESNRNQGKSYGTEIFAYLFELRISSRFENSSLQ